MPYATTADGTEIFYKDWGSRQPVAQRRLFDDRPTSKTGGRP